MGEYHESDERRAAYLGDSEAAHDVGLHLGPHLAHGLPVKLPTHARAWPVATSVITPFSNSIGLILTGCFSVF